MCVYCLIVSFMFLSHKYCLTFLYRARPKYLERMKTYIKGGNRRDEEQKEEHKIIVAIIFV